MRIQTAFSALIVKYTAARYAVALALAVFALGTRWALNPLLGDRLPYITLFPVIAFAALYLGVGPCMSALVVGLAGAKFWLVSPLHSFRIPNRADVVGMLAFALTAVLILAIAEVHHRRHELLLQAQDDLEAKVRGRTTELNTANQSLRQLTARLLELQDDERRRFARELHDSVGQTLTALAMNLSTVESDIEKLTKTAGTIQESTALVQDLSKEIRTISHLLHPPLLDESGLASALRWYIDGFAQRSCIKVELQLPNDFPRLPQESEIAIFRVVQECLTNIHRHSESQTARIHIVRSPGEVRVEIEDKGKGISSDKQSHMVSTAQPGVGVRGMRERLRQLGGTLEIHSAGPGKGTLVLAKLPTAGSSIAAA
jgi:signal transduction histidine kinase